MFQMICCSKFWNSSVWRTVTNLIVIATPFTFCQMPDWTAFSFPAMSVSHFYRLNYFSFAYNVSFTLSQIAGFDWWDDNQSHESFFSQTKQTLRTKPSCQFTAENERIPSLAKNWNLIVENQFCAQQGRWQQCDAVFRAPRELEREHEISCRNRRAAAFCPNIGFTNSNSQPAHNVKLEKRMVPPDIFWNATVCRTKHLIYANSEWRRRHKIGDEEVWLPRRLDKNWHRDLQSICRGE